jgi:hypothetical protein
MSKWTDKDFWLGRTDEQKAKRADAVEGMKKARQDLRDNNQQFKDNVAQARGKKADRDDDRRADYDATKAQNAADWDAKKDELRADREDRTLGGWGRKKDADDDVTPGA